MLNKGIINFGIHQKRLHKPFVVFSSPGSSDSILIAGKLLISDKDQFFKEPGFLFYPFNPSITSPKLFLQPDKIFEGSALIDDYGKVYQQISASENSIHLLKQTDKSSYIKNLENLINDLKSGSTEKVVFSRTSVTENISDHQLFQFYDLLCETYPAAFVYLVHFPPYGTWLGATPETLISCDNKQCQTMALAGTRKAGSQSKWGLKETEEQAIVSRYIQNVLLKHQVQGLLISKPFTRQAGGMEHLCTSFNFRIADDGSISQIIKDLHPTPAVCGTPKEKALHLIKKYENHHREYYTGFLGPVNLSGKTDLFVNLRCMKIAATQMILFTGGGITKDSIPKKEWEETELKTQTLLAVLEKIRNLAP